MAGVLVAGGPCGMGGHHGHWSSLDSVRTRHNLTTLFSLTMGHPAFDLIQTASVSSCAMSPDERPRPEQGVLEA